jgi:hypothetical protein
MLKAQHRNLAHYQQLDPLQTLDVTPHIVNLNLSSEQQNSELSELSQNKYRASRSISSRGSVMPERLNGGIPITHFVL